MYPSIYMWLLSPTVPSHNKWFNLPWFFLSLTHNLSVSKSKVSSILAKAQQGSHQWNPHISKCFLSSQCCSLLVLRLITPASSSWVRKLNCPGGCQCTMSWVPMKRKKVEVQGGLYIGKQCTITFLMGHSLLIGSHALLGLEGLTTLIIVLKPESLLTPTPEAALESPVAGGKRLFRSCSFILSFIFSGEIVPFDFVWLCFTHCYIILIGSCYILFWTCFEIISNRVWVYDLFQLLNEVIALAIAGGFSLQDLAMKEDQNARKAIYASSDITWWWFQN